MRILSPTVPSTASRALALTRARGLISATLLALAAHGAAQDAPSLLRPTLIYPVDPSLVLPADEDVNIQEGFTVAEMLGIAGVDHVDPDGDTLGIAIFGLTGSGHWQVDAGNGFSDVPGTVGGPTAALLLPPGAVLRFAPIDDANGLITAALGFRAWDRTGGTAFTVVSTTSNGGRAAFSEEVGTVSVQQEVIPVNDPPTVTSVGTIVLARTAIDVRDQGTAVADLIDAIAPNDVDSTIPSIGIAISAFDTALGQWSAKIGNGPWTPLVPLTGGQRLHLGQDDRIRLYAKGPARVATSGVLPFTLWDGSNGFAPGTIAFPDPTNAYGANVFQPQIDIAQPTNAAPVLIAGSYALTPAPSEDNAGPSALSPWNALANAYSDGNAGDGRGIAIIALAGEGTWQRSNGQVWIPIDSEQVSPTSALLIPIAVAAGGSLDPLDRLRFVPAPDFDGVATATIRAWDGTAGSDGGLADIADLGTGGGTAFSTATATLTVDVVGSQDAPTITASASVALPATSFGDDPAGITVTMILAGIAADDADTDAAAALHLAITSPAVSGGRFQYQDEALVWTDFPTLPAGAYLILAPTVSGGETNDTRGPASPRVRFLVASSTAPIGAVTPVPSLKATDLVGLDLGHGDIFTPTSADLGGGGAFSIGTGTLTVAIAASANLAPVLDGSLAMRLPVLAAGGGAGPGTTIAALLATGAGGAPISDANANDPRGIALLSANASAPAGGIWEISTSGGDAWTLVTGLGGGSNPNALVLAADAGTRIRYRPPVGFSGTVDPALVFLAWDRSDGAANGTLINASVRGGASSLSLASATATVTVAAPTVTLPAPTPALSSGAQTVYGPICPGTPQGIASFRAGMAGRDSTRARAFAWDGAAQAYVEFPGEPVGGIVSTTGIFLATRDDLGLDFSGSASAYDLDIVLRPGWTLFGVPPMDDAGTVRTAHDWTHFTLLDPASNPVTDPAQFTAAIGTPGAAIATARPYAWDGQAYAQVTTLESGKAYWVKNNLAQAYTLRLGASAVPPVIRAPGTAAAADVRSGAVGIATDRGVPPAPPNGLHTGGTPSKAIGGCGAGGGIAGIGMIALLALWRFLGRFVAVRR